MYCVNKLKTCISHLIGLFVSLIRAFGIHSKSLQIKPDEKVAEKAEAID